MLKEDIEGDCSLRTKIIKTFGGSAKNRLNAIFDEHNTFWSDFEHYKTNSAVIKLPIKIGFDPADLQKLRDHNARVNSCQVESNNESYSFSMMDIVTNPHLMCLIYDTDGKTIIGRSVIRLFKDNEEEDSKTYIAPSRLYLSNYTHAKTELYNSLFVAVNEWGLKNFKKSGSQLIAATQSLHDTAPSDYLLNTKFRKLMQDDNPARLTTQWWHTWFNEKPDASDARFIYYQDENMGTTTARVPDYGNSSQEYAVRESLGYRQFVKLEVKDENEQ
jgi:hypothetical protein